MVTTNVTAANYISLGLIELWSSDIFMYQVIFEFVYRVDKIVYWPCRIISIISIIHSDLCTMPTHG